MTDEIDDNCPFCPVEYECEKHLLAYFATTEGKIKGGELRNCEAEINKILLHALTEKKAEDLPGPLCDIICLASIKSTERATIRRAEFWAGFSGVFPSDN